jgi:hypothetical protein
LLCGILYLFLKTVDYLALILELLEKFLKLLQLFVLSLKLALQSLVFLLQLIHPRLIVLLVFF